MRGMETCDWRNPPDKIEFSLKFKGLSLGEAFYRALNNCPLECFTILESDGTERQATPEERLAYLRDMASPLN